MVTEVLHVIGRNYLCFMGEKAELERDPMLWFSESEMPETFSDLNRSKHGGLCVSEKLNPAGHTGGGVRL